MFIKQSIAVYDLNMCVLTSPSVVLIYKTFSLDVTQDHIQKSTQWYSLSVDVMFFSLLNFNYNKLTGS